MGEIVDNRKACCAGGLKSYFFSKSLNYALANEDNLIELAMRSKTENVKPGPTAAVYKDPIVPFVLGIKESLPTTGQIESYLRCLPDEVEASKWFASIDSFILLGENFNKAADESAKYAVRYGVKHECLRRIEKRDWDLYHRAVLIRNICSENAPPENTTGTFLTEFVAKWIIARSNFDKFKLLLELAASGYRWDALVLLSFGKDLGTTLERNVVMASLTETIYKRFSKLEPVLLAISDDLNSVVKLIERDCIDLAIDALKSFMLKNESNPDIVQKLEQQVALCVLGRSLLVRTALNNDWQMFHCVGDAARKEFTKHGFFSDLQPVETITAVFEVIQMFLHLATFDGAKEQKPRFMKDDGMGVLESLLVSWDKIKFFTTVREEMRKRSVLLTIRQLLDTLPINHDNVPRMDDMKKVDCVDLALNFLSFVVDVASSTKTGADRAKLPISVPRKYMTHAEVHHVFLSLHREPECETLPGDLKIIRAKVKHEIRVFFEIHGIQGGDAKDAVGNSLDGSPNVPKFDKVAFEMARGMSGYERNRNPEYRGRSEYPRRPTNSLPNAAPNCNSYSTEGRTYPNNFYGNANPGRHENWNDHRPGQQSAKTRDNMSQHRLGERNFDHAPTSYKSRPTNPGQFANFEPPVTSSPSFTSAKEMFNSYPNRIHVYAPVVGKSQSEIESLRSNHEADRDSDRTDPKDLCASRECSDRNTDDLVTFGYEPPTVQKDEKTPSSKSQSPEKTLDRDEELIRHMKSMIQGNSSEAVENFVNKVAIDGKEQEDKTGLGVSSSVEDVTTSVDMVYDFDENLPTDDATRDANHSSSWPPLDAKPDEQRGTSYGCVGDDRRRRQNSDAASAADGEVYASPKHDSNVKRDECKSVPKAADEGEGFDIEKTMEVGEAVSVNPRELGDNPAAAQALVAMRNDERVQRNENLSSDIWEEEDVRLPQNQDVRSFNDTRANMARGVGDGRGGSRLNRRGGRGMGEQRVHNQGAYSDDGDNVQRRRQPNRRGGYNGFQQQRPNA